MFASFSFPERAVLGVHRFPRFHGKVTGTLLFEARFPLSLPAENIREKVETFGFRADPAQSLKKLLHCGSLWNGRLLHDCGVTQIPRAAVLLFLHILLPAFTGSKTFFSFRKAKYEPLYRERLSWYQPFSASLLKAPCAV
jgi:hypothetical protein